MNNIKQLYETALAEPSSHTLEECQALASRLAEEISRRLGISVCLDITESLTVSNLTVYNLVLRVPGSCPASKQEAVAHFQGLLDSSLDHTGQSNHSEADDYDTLYDHLASWSQDLFLTKAV